MPNLLIEDIPKDILARARKLKKPLGVTEWVSWFYHATRITEGYIKENNLPRKKGILRRCFICGNDDNCLEHHHIVPRKEGGSDDPSNMLWLCANHHTLVEKGVIFIEKAGEWKVRIIYPNGRVVIKRLRTNN